jgi:hypothetical protein
MAQGGPAELLVCGDKSVELIQDLQRARLGCVAVDLKDVIAKSGTLVHIPGGTTHSFRFGVGGGEMISMTSRAGASAFFTEGRRRDFTDRP